MFHLKKMGFVIIVWCVGVSILSTARLTRATIGSTPPRVFLLDAKQLEATRQRVRNGDAQLAPAIAKLERDAKKVLTAGPFSVTTKEATPPSGDKHDYMSQAPYFWPD